MPTLNGPSYSAVTTQYDYASFLATGGVLNPRDTTSLFSLDAPVQTPPIVRVPFTLPGLPYQLSTPNQKTVQCNASSTGIPFVVLPPDWALTPVPMLGDFRAVFLYSVGDYAHIQWNGSLWSLVDAGGPTAVVKDPTQSVTTITQQVTFTDPLTGQMQTFTVTVPQP